MGIHGEMDGYARTAELPSLTMEPLVETAYLQRLIFRQRLI